MHSVRNFLSQYFFFVSLILLLVWRYSHGHWFVITINKEMLLQPCTYFRHSLKGIQFKAVNNWSRESLTPHLEVSRSLDDKRALFLSAVAVGNLLRIFLSLILMTENNLTNKNGTAKLFPTRLCPLNFGRLTLIAASIATTKNITNTKQTLFCPLQPFHFCLRGF